MALSGTKTLENLKHAFAGESQANRRYLHFARRADIGGYPEVGGLFRDITPRLPVANRFGFGGVPTEDCQFVAAP